MWMRLPSIPFFRAQPFLIIPQSEEEEKLGKPILITPGEATVIANCLEAMCGLDCADLIKKYRALAEL